jgi:hypothetical protein
MGNCIGYMYIKDMDNKKKSKTQALLNHVKYDKQNEKMSKEKDLTGELVNDSTT